MDHKKVEKGRKKNSSKGRIFHSSFFLSFSHPFVIHSFAILSRFSALDVMILPSSVRTWRWARLMVCRLQTEKGVWIQSKLYSGIASYYHFLNSRLLTFELRISFTYWRYEFWCEKSYATHICKNNWFAEGFLTPFLWCPVLTFGRVLTPRLG